MRAEATLRPENERALLDVAKAARALLTVFEKEEPDARDIVFNMHDPAVALRDALANLDRLNP